MKVLARLLVCLLFNKCTFWGEPQSYVVWKTQPHSDVLRRSRVVQFLGFGNVLSHAGFLRK